VNDKNNNDRNNTAQNQERNKDPKQESPKQGFSRRTFLQVAGGGGLALTAGCLGDASGGRGWMPAQYEGTGNLPTQVRGRIPIDPLNLTIQRDDRLCNVCGQCIEVCDRYQAVFRHYELPLHDYIPCIGCGQCTLWCPSSSIVERDNTQQLWDALNNPDHHVVIQTAPSTRIGLGEEFGLSAGTNVEGKQVAALRALGFDTVLDTNFGADLTIMEEASELVKRLTSENPAIPMFTSCCPGWVKYCEMWFPEFLENLSTARSPMAMLSAVVKTYYAKRKNIDPANIVSVAVMPCTAKKYEAARPEMNNSGMHHGNPAIQDTDIVITTRELARMIRRRNIDFLTLENSPYDNLLSEYSGGGAIFGVTGGVMQAAVRSAYYFVTGNNPPPEILDLKAVRGLEGIRETVLEIPGFGELRIAVVSGTANAKRALEQIKNGSRNWHFVEVMACSGGCISGGGQPRTTLPPANVMRYPRTGALYTIDARQVAVRSSHENPEIKRIYEEFLGEPYTGELAYKLLHSATSDFRDRSMHLTAKR